MNTQALRTAKPDHPEWDIGRCRYCGLPVVGRRRTFCSDACVHEWRLRAWPSYLRAAVFTRDAGICALCGLDTKELPEERRWGYRPVLLETFVDPRHEGSCYKAAGWEALGMTSGEGLVRPGERYSTTPKRIFVKPWCPEFRSLLCSELPPSRGLQ